ncbi:peptidoglycan-binding protein [Streptomyces marispadix]|uniref:Peptidoglycan-binding protein n=1 Tax=Streptomyces marispadix TaxID=2922868 RepID=A0ABS9SUY1_9ACTN|nr:peptidoglycan-binding domain-containing protein [Streptomyces marispadix]MCH6160080.1 peptidoglycan-binding protein [Streptomyces marispadix]
MGPFTAEHVDPMHIRPYVDLPEPEDEGSQTPDLEPFARCGQGETAELPVFSAYEGQLEPSGQQAPAAFGAWNQEGGPDVAPDVTPHGRGRARRRRRVPAKAAFAAAGVVAALGAGLLTTQALSDDGGSGDDRSLSTDDTALPDISGGPTEDPSRTEKRSKKPSGEQTSRKDSASARADRNGGEHTGRGSAPAPVPSSSTPGTPSEPDGRGRGHGGGWGDHDGDRDRPRPPQESTQPGGETLRPGDRGPEVTELQRRLKQAGALDEDAPEDGVYSRDVQQAVARFQSWNDVRGDEFGEYGPNTRRALESQTSG